MYKAILDYFFNDNDLSIRIVIVRNKNRIKNFETYYFKMMYQLLIKCLSVEDVYNIYLDIKDTRSAPKIDILHTVLSNKKNDQQLTNNIIKIQTIRSYESPLLQIADIIMGALVYNYSNIETSEAKINLIQHLSEFSSRSLKLSTAATERKFNRFYIDPRENYEEMQIDNCF